MYITIGIPFAKTEAEVHGYYYPSFWEDESEFEIDKFFVGGRDILSEIVEMHVRLNSGKYVPYLDSIEEQIYIKADEYYAARSEE